MLVNNCSSANDFFRDSFRLSRIQNSLEVELLRVSSLFFRVEEMEKKNKETIEKLSRKLRNSIF